MKANIKISQFSRFLLRSEYAIQVEIWKWLKLLNSYPFIKKPLVNQVYIRIWSFWLTFTVLQWMKKNSKNSQFSSFLLRSGYAILVKIWKWLKLLNSVPFIKKRLLNHVYIRIWSSWLTFTVSQGMKANIKISQFSRFLLRSEYPIQVKIWKWLKLLNSVPFIKKPLVNQVYIRIWSFWLTFTVLQWMMKNSKNCQFSRFPLRSGYAILVKIWKWVKLLNSFPFIKKRLLNHVYIRIWWSWLTFKVSQGIKANIKISQFSRFLLRFEYAIQVNSVPFIKKPLVNEVCIWIWSFWLTFTVLQWMKKNSKNSQFSSFLLKFRYPILVKIWKWLKLLNSYPFIKKRLVNHVYIRIWSSWLTFTVSQGMKANIKISQFSRFLLRSEYPIQVKIWKWLKLLNSVPFIKKPLVNQVCIWIWSFWLTFTVLQWMKKNSKNSQFSSFLLRSGYAILFKIWKWLKLLNSVPFIKKRLLNHVYIRIWSSWLTFTVSQGMKANIKISQFSRFLLRSKYPIQVKIWKWLKLLNSVPFIKKPLVNQAYIRIWSFWLTFTVLQWMNKNSKNSQFSSFLLRSGYAI